MMMSLIQKRHEVRWKVETENGSRERGEGGERGERGDETAEERGREEEGGERGVQGWRCQKRYTMSWGVSYRSNWLIP